MIAFIIFNIKLVKYVRRKISILIYLFSRVLLFDYLILKTSPKVERVVPNENIIEIYNKYRSG